jgi:hypothetical protein
MYKSALKAIPAVVTAFILSACGGGGGSSGADAPSSASTPLLGNPPITLAGNAPTITGVAGNVSVLFVPATLTGSGLPQGTSINASIVPLSALVQESTHGAFTTIASANANPIKETGSVYEIGGVGGTFAIGRWTDGSDTSGGTYNKNQGAPYAVGSPLTLTSGNGSRNRRRQRFARYTELHNRNARPRHANAQESEHQRFDRVRSILRRQRHRRLPDRFNDFRRRGDG